MKTLFISLFTLFVSVVSFANTHILVKQNGEKMEVNYVTTKNHLVIYTLPGDTVEHQISLFAVQKIVDKTSNVSVLENNKIDLSGKNGYKNVVFLNQTEADGLKKAEDLSVDILKVKGQNLYDWERSAEKRLKEKSAQKGYAYIVITEKTDSKIKAVAYTY